MTIEQGFLWFAELVMLVALGCFVQGFRVRKTNNALHQKLGKSGALLVIVGLVAVEVLLRGLGWKFPVRDVKTLHVHIAVASGALAVLLALVFTGMRGPKKLHVKLYLLFFPLYLATVVTSVLAFRLW
jgi:hypothetical protein